MRLSPPVRELLPDMDRVLARAGCPPGRSGEIADSVREAISTLGLTAVPEAVYASFPVDSMEGGLLRAGGVGFRSADLCRRLEGVSTVSLFAATLGPDPERTSRELSSRGRHLAGFLLDAAASSAVERLCTKMHGLISAGMPGFDSTVRYAPGYGDFRLADQAVLLDLLGAGEIGIVLIPGSHTLVPVKSATGVMGWAKRHA